MTRFTCPVCAREHEELPVYSFEGPSPWAQARREGKGEEYELGPDLCRRGDDEFYIRGRLPIPILDAADQDLMISGWVKVSKDNFWRYRTKFLEWDAATLGVFYGWFANQVPGYGETVNLKVAVHPQNDRMRPLLAVEPTEAMLATTQRSGVTLDHAMRWLHENGGF